MGIGISSIEYYLPPRKVTNHDLGIEFPDWDLDKISLKSGVYQRFVADSDVTAFDLACHALNLAVEKKNISKGDIDGVIFCTQNPDYHMPSNAFLIHKYLDLPDRVWAFDYNLACSGYIYGLALCKGMILAGLAENILLITSDTYSKMINPSDRSTRVLFSDAAAVSLISKSKTSELIDIILASNGKEFSSFYIPGGGTRSQKEMKEPELAEKQRIIDSKIKMNGFAVWKFISKTVPVQIQELLGRNNLEIDDIDFFGFHQASRLTLNSLIKSTGIDENKVFSNLASVGNTVSASIPILLKQAIDAGKLNRGELVLLSGFGVGLSWGSALLKF